MSAMCWDNYSHPLSQDYDFAFRLKIILPFSSNVPLS